MGEFSVAIAYKLIAYDHTAEADDVWKRIWILHVPKWSNKDYPNFVKPFRPWIYIRERWEEFTIIH